MHIATVTLPTPNPDAVAAFYRDVLDLPVTGRQVSVGHSRIELTDAEESPGSQHLAFNIPADSFTAAKEWLRARTPLLTRDEQEEFHFGPPVDADSVYFLDPDGTILELIARAAVPAAHRAGEFDAGQIVGVSEVGVPVRSVPETVEQLGIRLGLTPLVRIGDGFAAVGDQDGLLILVLPERPLLPTEDRVLNRTPVRIESPQTNGARFEFSYGSVLVGEG